MVNESLPYLAPEKLFPALSGKPGFCWLDHALGEEASGCSVMAVEPFLVLKAKRKKITLVTEKKQYSFTDCPFQVLQELLREYHLSGKDFWSPGCLGYLAYDLGRQIERLPEKAVDDLNIPDLWLGFYDRILVFDHRRRKLYYRAANVTGSRNFFTELKRSLLFWKGLQQAKVEQDTPACLETLSFNMSRPAYCQAIKRIKDYIAAGDVYQINFAQRVQASGLFPDSLYLKLRQVNPTAYSGYLQTGSFSILSNSPELFLQKSGSRVVTRPMKGTRPRGQNQKQDRLYREELLRSEKDAAELLMIVDLERNDLGKVCQAGSVRVKKLRILESYPTVFQTTAQVEGRLKPGSGAVDLLLATFPGGSITGAPKIRAMEIIEELEPHQRAFYTGCLGYLGFNGCLELNIMIRTILRQGKNLYYPVGGGIVWDSTPEEEYQETLTKAQALFLTLGVAGEPELARVSV
ncbi:MAG TPA: aminodeoxychorismate synthase component I [bacterium]|nr:aminodeoxychorismate synthase component I [bacterium]HOL66451.1 aminodeoxychorismate synthase component I [bacterium]HPP11957.1 aminodeoxychorismate synthase component I [bacterium]